MNGGLYGDFPSPRQHGSFDTHANELASHAKLWNEVSTAVADFMDDLKEHGKDKDTVVLMFSEFGRRIRDNGAIAMARTTDRVEWRS